MAGALSSRRQRPSTAVVRVARSAPQMPLDQIAAAVGVTTDKTVATLKTLPARGGCAQTLAAAAASSNPAAAAAALVSRRCPPPHRRAAADNTTNPADTVSWAQRERPRVDLLRSLASSQLTRWVAAANGPCWPMLAVALSDDPDPDIGWAAIANPCMEPHMFARSANSDTRYAAALNPNCGRDLLEILLCDNDFQTKHQAAEWSLAGEVLLDAAAAVAQPGASRRLQRLTKAWRTDPEKRESIARSKSCGPLLLEGLTRDPERTVRAAAAANPNCTPEMLRHLAESVDEATEPFIASSVASNPSCGPVTLTLLSAATSESVRTAVASNPNTTVAALSRLASNPEPEVRSAAAANPNCNPAVLVAAATDTGERVRCSVAANRSCPGDVFDRLLQDPDPEVRAAAATNPGCAAGNLWRLALDANSVVAEAARTVIVARGL